MSEVKKRKPRGCYYPNRESCVGCEVLKGPYVKMFRWTKKELKIDDEYWTCSFTGRIVDKNGILSRGKTQKLTLVLKAERDESERKDREEVEKLRGMNSRDRTGRKLRNV